MEVFIVTKTSMATLEGGIKIPFSTNEGVFPDEKSANAYIAKRKAAKDRDDRGCKFAVEPWAVQTVV